MPQIATFATPGTPISRGLTVQRAITDCSIGVSSLEESPIISTLLDEDRGGSTTEGLEIIGHAAPPSWVSRSCTSWRPR